MKITGIYPAMKVVKENDVAGEDIFIANGDKVTITRFDDVKISGTYIDTEWATDEEMDDMLHLTVNGNKDFSIGVSYIKDIEVV